MKVVLARDMLFHDCSCHAGGGGYKQYKAGATAWAVQRDAIKDAAHRREMVAAFERRLAAGGRPVVVRLGGGYRLVERSDVLTEKQMEERRKALRRV